MDVLSRERIFPLTLSTFAYGDHCVDDSGTHASQVSLFFFFFFAFEDK